MPSSSEPPTPCRWVAHLDMDAFYAAVELLRYPMLRGLAVVVGGRRIDAPQLQPDGSRRFSRLRDYVGRGVVTTATYEARALGVHSGQGLMRAAALAPEAVLLPADFDEYRRCSRLFKEAVAAVAPVIEDRGIDEIYIDLTTLAPPYATAERQREALAAIAARIKAGIRAATGLTCSIGITPNKLLAKICSEFGKPDGLTILTEADVPQRVWPLPVRRINGIGPKAGARLEALGIRTIGELASADPRWLIDRFGAHYGTWLHEAAHGRDASPVVTSREPRSISRETTFERDLHPSRDRRALGAIFTSLCEQLATDLARKGYRAGSIGVKVRFDDFAIATREVSLPSPVHDARSIRRWAGQCLKKHSLGRRLRLLGVRAGRLCRAEPDTGPGHPGASNRQLDLELART